MPGHREAHRWRPGEATNRPARRRGSGGLVAARRPSAGSAPAPGRTRSPRAGLTTSCPVSATRNGPCSMRRAELGRRAVTDVVCAVLVSNATSPTTSPRATKALPGALDGDLEVPVDDDPARAAGFAFAENRGIRCDLNRFGKTSDLFESGRRQRGEHGEPGQTSSSQPRVSWQTRRRDATTRC